ncbi:hypothetical protein CAEBREN_22541 [Caenorhabditis brenneri]|uniref:JmjC domain-containing protein n=1 Tax=Caenorhabditis brenneri TaxID=135651 RepID=G0N652_CAEBE|nr:hypothetical protein CAEBREN_22541 [Caenorhabditis brenneri]
MSSSSKVDVSDLAAPAQSGAAVPSGSQNAPSIQARRGTDNAPPPTQPVGETTPLGKRACKVPGRFTQNSEESLTASDLYKRLNQSSMASMAGEPSRKRARPAGSIRAQPQMVAAQPSTSVPGSRVSKAGEPSQKRAKTAGRIQGLSQAPAAQPSTSGSSSQAVQVQDDAPQPSTSLGIQTDTPPTTHDAATMPEISENVDVGIQTVPQVDAPPQPSTSLGIQTDTPPATHDAATMPETSEHVAVGIQTTSSSQDEAAQTDSACFLEFSTTSSVSCSPPSVSNCETQTGAACSLEFTGVSSVSFTPVAVLDSATQAEDPVRSLELSEVSSESVSQEVAAPQDEPEEQPSTSSPNPARDALAALNQRTWTPTTPTSSSSVEPVARRLRSRAAETTPVVSRLPSSDEGCVAGRLQSKAVAPTHVASRSPSPIAHRLRRRGPANPEETAAELPPPKTREEFQERLKNLDQGSKGFIREWSRGEHLLDNTDAENVFISETGHEFMAKVETSHGVHLVKNKEGLKMKVPEDLDFHTVRDYIKTDKELSVINSNTQVPELMTMSKLLKEFGKTVRTAIYNLLSLEFAQTEDRLKKAFEEPAFVKSYSMIMKLEKALEDLKKKLGRKLRTAAGVDEKEKIEEKIKKINNQLKTMPKFQKFLLLSMSGSFTDIHVDFSGTSVFYHVIKGRKIFYVAPPTPENLELYKKIERHEFGDEWIGDMLFDQWVRIEIREGQTAMIPSGYLHFVYTPEDSIVIGGNFLMEKYVERQFE